VSQVEGFSEDDTGIAVTGPLMPTARPPRGQEIRRHPRTQSPSLQRLPSTAEILLGLGGRAPGLTVPSGHDEGKRPGGQRDELHLGSASRREESFTSGRVKRLLAANDRYSSSSSQIRIFLTRGAPAGAAGPLGDGSSGSWPSRYSCRAAPRTRTSTAGTASHHCKA
jgi:hypothetical protein